MKLEAMTMAPEEAPGFENLYDEKDFVDDIPGAPLDKKMAIAARRLEM